METRTQRIFFDEFLRSDSRSGTVESLFLSCQV